MICEKPPIVKIVPARTNGIYRVTAYCPCSKCCGKWSDGMTASGAPVKGKLIAAPKDIPFGTWLNVPGYGWAEVKDRGGSIKGKRLDVFFESHQEAMNWGVQYLEIRLWDPTEDGQKKARGWMGGIYLVE
jgi:3D (Asp-Asp-Asp) domain-containing protein